LSPAVFCDLDLDCRAMGIRTRGLDIRINARRQVADSAARRGKGRDDHWNEQLAAGREMPWSPTIRAALIAGLLWLDVDCPGCGTVARLICGPPPSARLGRHPGARIAMRRVSGLGADGETASLHPSGEPASISGGRRCSAVIVLGRP